jgi:hypothetical protein
MGVFCTVEKWHLRQLPFAISRPSAEMAMEAG